MGTEAGQSSSITATPVALVTAVSVVPVRGPATIVKVIVFPATGWPSKVYVAIAKPVAVSGDHVV